MTVPQSIRSAAARRPSRVSAGLRMPVERGQVLTIRVPEGDPVPERMVLVLRLDQHHQSSFAEIMLVHPHVELAVNSDLIVSPEHSTLPYGMVTQANTRGVVWEHQLGALIGKLDHVALDALGDVAVGQTFEREGLTTGPPLRGRFDPRWDFKAGEGEAIRALAADCTSVLLSSDGSLLQLPSTMEEVCQLDERGWLEPDKSYQQYGHLWPDVVEYRYKAAAYKLAA